MSDRKQLIAEAYEALAELDEAIKTNVELAQRIKARIEAVVAAWVEPVVSEPTPEPSRCPTCGSDDPEAHWGRLLQDGGPERCRDLFHRHNLGVVPGSTREEGE